MTDEESTGGFPRLWATWRMEYLKKLRRKVTDTVFSELPQEEDGPNNLIMHRGSTCYIVLNLYPYNTGHCMVVPFRIVTDLSEMTDEEMLEMMQLTDLATRSLVRCMNAHGFNVGLNLGKLAGAGIPNHLHLHIVPRWQGDTNFMPTIGKTKVVPESLEATYHRLRAAIREELDESSKEGDAREPGEGRDPGAGGEGKSS